MRNSDYDSRIIISRSRQVSLIMLVVLAIIGFTVLILKAQDAAFGWLPLALPLSALGCLFLPYPSTEQWEYKAWQGKPRKVEQHFDR